MNNEKLVSEHMNTNFITKLLEAEMNEQGLSRALVGMKTSNGQDLAERLVELFKHRMGSKSGKVETVKESVAILLRQEGSNL